MNNMAKQMDMFDEGGLMDEGGTVDPVSGNDVPPGSTQEEVRDDIPAQLSEGEFVFPADVVRYFGLEKLMEMRQEAKMGLQRMEDMGQMGNSEEAIMPDNLPFSIEDLDTEDEGEYNTPQEFAYGGVVQMPGTNYNTTPNPGPTTGFRPYVAPSIPGYTPPPVQTGPQYQGIQLPGTQFIGATPATNIPTFGQTVGTNPGQYDEFKTYVNSSGQTLQIPFKNGQPLYPIPQGYTLQKEDAVKTESTVPTTTVGQDSEPDGDQFEQDQEDMKQGQARVDAAKELGYKEFAGIGQNLSSAFGLTTLPEGTVTSLGYISDGAGNLVDPVTGIAIPAGLIDSIKNSVSTLKGIGKSIIANKGLPDPVTQQIIAKGYGANSAGVRNIQRNIATAKVSKNFDSIRQDIKDGKYGVDFNDFKANYINSVERAIATQISRGNIDPATGRTISSAEANRNQTERGSDPVGSIGDDMLAGLGDPNYDPTYGTGDDMLAGLGDPNYDPTYGTGDNMMDGLGGRKGVSSQEDLGTGRRGVSSQEDLGSGRRGVSSQEDLGSGYRGSDDGPGDSNNDNDGPSNEGGQADSGSGGGQVGSENEDGDGFDGNKGGLVSQMKRSGLASKK